jgi:hypothetical protein
MPQPPRRHTAGDMIATAIAWPIALAAAYASFYLSLVFAWASDTCYRGTV